MLTWMAWTPVTAGFFATIALLLGGMTAWEAVAPCVPRRGLLPLTTTRGDRLFIGLLVAAFINLAWIAGTDLSQWYPLAISVIVILLVGRFG